MLTLELAQLAARHIAEEGLSYGEAKRKAAKQVGVAEHGAAMPANEDIEQALRDYQAEFMGDTQPAELRHLRQLALKWMQFILTLQGLNAPCQALAIGAVVNGTAGEHSPVHLHVFTDEDKYFDIALLNAGIECEQTTKKVDGGHCPVWVAQDQGVPIVLTVLPAQRYKSPPDLPSSAGAYLQTASASQLNQLLSPPVLGSL
jgi:hypothetical protein